MTDVELQLNAWTDNPGTSVFAVQGEQESRTLHVTLIDRTGISSDVMSVAKTTPRYVDLTGYTARLYVVKADGTKVYFPGEITDGASGKVDFVLTGQSVAAPGKAECTIVLTKEDVELKVVGMTLDVQKNDLEGSMESSDEWVDLEVMLDRAEHITQQAAAAEAERVQAEAARAAAETKRQTDYTTDMQILSGALSSLDKSYQAFEAAETERQSAEAARQAAETKRQTDTTAAVSAANAAADRANAAAGAIEETDIGDLAVRMQSAEGDIDQLKTTASGLQSDLSGLGATVDAHREDLSALQSGKVDKIAGKGLSANDFTAAYKMALDDLVVKDITTQFAVTGTYASKVKLTGVYQFGRLILMDGNLIDIPDGWLDESKIAVKHKTSPSAYLPVVDTPVHVGANNTGYASGALTYQAGGGIYGNASHISGATLGVQMTFIRKGS